MHKYPFGLEIFLLVSVTRVLEKVKGQGNTCLDGNDISDSDQDLKAMNSLERANVVHDILYSEDDKYSGFYW